MTATARLIAVSQPTDGSSAEALVAYCARVSNPKNQANPDAAGLLRYLLRNAHWSPFEMAHAVVEIETTRDIARQLLRHRSFAFQEFSQRYAKAPPAPVLRDARMQHPTNRQASLPAADEDLRGEWADAQTWVWQIAMGAYEDAINRGMAREVARAVLPEGLTGSRLYMAGSLRSWLHYLEVRRGNGTQPEHVAVAEAITEALRPAFPTLLDMLHPAPGRAAGAIGSYDE